MGVDYRTVQRWVAWYRAGGMAAVRSHRLGGPGQPPRLTPEQQEQLASEVATGRFRNAASIGAWIAETYGVIYTEGGMYSLLARLRCAPKVPRPLHEKANLEEQEAWKRGDLRTR
jgi:transposase